MRVKSASARFIQSQAAITTESSSSTTRKAMFAGLNTMVEVHDHKNGAVRKKSIIKIVSSTWLFSLSSLPLSSGSFGESSYRFHHSGVDNRA